MTRSGWGGFLQGFGVKYELDLRTDRSAA